MKISPFSCRQNRCQNTPHKKRLKVTIIVFNIIITIIFSECSGLRMDLWYLIDGSDSIGSSNFQTCLRFVNLTASAFTISRNSVRTGLMVYNQSTHTESNFNDHQSNDDFSNAVFSSSYPGGLSRFVCFESISNLLFKYSHEEIVQSFSTFFLSQSLRAE